MSVFKIPRHFQMHWWGSYASLPLLALLHMAHCKEPKILSSSAHTTVYWPQSCIPIGLLGPYQHHLIGCPPPRATHITTGWEQKPMCVWASVSGLHEEKAVMWGLVGSEYLCYMPSSSPKAGHLSSEFYKLSPLHLDPINACSLHIDPEGGDCNPSSCHLSPKPLTARKRQRDQSRNRTWGKRVACYWEPQQRRPTYLGEQRQIATYEMKDGIFTGPKLYILILNFLWEHQAIQAAVTIWHTSKCFSDRFF